MGKYRPLGADARARRRRGHRHTHGGAMLSIDRYAQNSRLHAVSPFVKMAFALAVLVLCVAADSAAVGLLVSVGMLLACILLGGAPVRYVFSLMTIPVLFLAVSCLAIAFEVGRAPLGFLDVPLFGFYLSATPGGVRRALLLFFKAYGAVTCLYFLSLTTPIQEILEVLRAARLPKLVIELMYLIYRYIFLLLDAQHRMTVAAQSRLGYASRHNAWYTFTHISGNLLASSFRRSGACFDAMESRCYEGTLRFLTRHAPVRARHVAVCALCLALLTGFAVLIKWKGVDLF